MLLCYQQVLILTASPCLQPAIPGARMLTRHRPTRTAALAWRMRRMLPSGQNAGFPREARELLEGAASRRLLGPFSGITHG